MRFSAPADSLHAPNSHQQNAAASTSSSSHHPLASTAPSSSSPVKQRQQAHIQLASQQTASGSASFASEQSATSDNNRHIHLRGTLTADAEDAKLLLNALSPPKKVKQSIEICNLF